MDKEMEKIAETSNEAPQYKPDNIVSEVSPKKKKGGKGKIVALALCCFIAGGAVGAGGVIAFDAFSGHGRAGLRGLGHAGRYAGQYDIRNPLDDNSNDSSSDKRQKSERQDRNKDSSDSNRGDQSNRGQGKTDRDGKNRSSSDRKRRSGNGKNSQTPADNGQTPEPKTTTPSESSGTANG